MQASTAVGDVGARQIAPHRVYDSSRLGSPVTRELRELWARRRLLRFLAVRDMTLRYKRSVLGVWWTLINPLLKTLVLWAVLSGVFRAADIGVPYVVYLLSGIMMITLFEQAVLRSGSSLVDSSAVISKVHVPSLAFAVSAVIAAGVTFAVSLVPLLGLQLATGTGIPWTVVLVPLPALAVMAMAAGVGLLVAAVAVRLYDALDLTAVLLQLLAFITPTFYPLASIPEPARMFIEANPITQALVVLRGFVYEGAFAPWWSFAVAFGAGAALLIVGIVVFSRSWRKTAVML